VWRRQAVLKATATSASRLCRLGGPTVSAELAPTSASQVVSSPAAQRLTPVRFIVVKKELELIAFSVLFRGPQCNFYGQGCNFLVLSGIICKMYLTADNMKP
jgi:hypothetical protein